MRKLLSLLLAVLMIVSCVPAVMFVGASAEETQTPEAPAVSYKDPREDATKVYYALGGSLTATDKLVTADEDFVAENVLNSGYNIWGVLCNDKIMKHTFEAGSVLVVKFKGSLTGFPDGKNASLKKSQYNFLGACTIFREDNTKLPIIIEGVEANRASTISCVSDTKIYAFANDFYFTNLTFYRNYSSAKASTLTLYAGAGEVTFDNVKFDLTGNVVFAGDNYCVDAFYGWQSKHIDANKDADGLLPSSFTFGKGTAIPTSAASGVVITAVAADGHSGSGNYKNAYLASSATLDQAAVNNITPLAAAQRFYIVTNVDAPSLIQKTADCVVYPSHTKAAIIIDNGNANSDTADFGNIYVRRGCNAVGASDLKILSGNVNQVYLDSYSAATTKEVYSGDINLVVDGGKIVTRVYGLKSAFLIGDYTAELKSGFIQRFDGTDSDKTSAALYGNYLFYATGGEMVNYYGGCEAIGEGHTVKTVVDGGTFTTLFNCIRFAVSSITNEINGGIFNCDFRGGSNDNYSGSSITNVITGGVFNFNFYAGGTHASATLGTVTTNISGGSFKYIGKGGAKASSNTVNVISTKATDEIKLNGAAVTSPRGYEFDKFEMNGGTVIFWAVKVTANNAKGNIVVRNIGEWLDDNTYFTFTPAEGAALNVTTTQDDSVTTRGTVNVVDGKYLVQADTRVIEPSGARLILTERIAVKFVFGRDEIDSIGKENFEFSVIMNGVNLLEGVALVEEGNTYTMTTKGIGLPDSNTTFKLSGPYVKADEWSIASLAEKAAESWTGDWKAWAVALQNMIGVVIDGGENKLTPADKDYGAYAVEADKSVVTEADLALVMNSAVGAELNLTFVTLPEAPVVKVNGKEFADVYTTDGNVATISIYFAPQAMEKTFAVELFDGTTEIFSLNATVAGLAKELNTDNGNALLAYIQATTVVAGK